MAPESSTGVGVTAYHASNRTVTCGARIDSPTLSKYATYLSGALAVLGGPAWSLVAATTVVPCTDGLVPTAQG